jgi:hypothetical protein
MRLHSLVFSFLTSLLLCLNEAQALSCKALPGTSSWPSDAEWKALNKSLSGNLLKPSPPAAVCHPSDPSYSPAACTVVTTQWTDGIFHANDPISGDFPNWNNDSCLPSPQAPCSGLGYPIYVVNASCAEHVSLGINFARKHNIRLNVKGSGHDYLGR